ncbi:hypothetical protein [Arenicella xantha]|uniref:Uncharacterized protein n=1 Tax=Arenicella xantha TaxID=644221 RepID=A0A395JMW2_9GAMM|nr:hypothetical protein [Arenicella xantha]RBP52889.1 hypothetical protein DFR28_101273 [Arenicella xantha]
MTETILHIPISSTASKSPPVVYLKVTKRRFFCFLCRHCRFFCRWCFKTTPYKDSNLTQSISEIVVTFPETGDPTYKVNFQISTPDYSFANKGLTFKPSNMKCKNDVKAVKLYDTDGRTNSVLQVAFTDKVSIEKPFSVSFNVKRGASSKTFLADPQIKITRKTN